MEPSIPLTRKPIEGLHPRVHQVRRQGMERRGTQRPGGDRFAVRAGPSAGAVPLTGIAIAKAGIGSNLRGFIMRKEPKGRGGRKTGNPPGIEGSTIQSGDRVLILEDVTTTGGSALKAVERLQDMGCNVVACISIVDREEGGKEAFEAAGIPLHALTTLSDYA